MVWQPNIINNCYELSGGSAPANHPPGALPLGPAGGLPFPRPPVPPSPNPGYATARGKANVGPIKALYSDIWSLIDSGEGKCRKPSHTRRPVLCHVPTRAASASRVTNSREVAPPPSDSRPCCVVRVTNSAPCRATAALASVCRTRSL